MPINPDEIVWDESPAAPAINPDEIEWDAAPSNKPMTGQEKFSDFAVGATGMTRGALNHATDSKLGDFLMSALGHPVDKAKGSGWQTLGQVADPLAWATGTKAAQAVPYQKVLGGGKLNAIKAMLTNTAMGAGTGGAVGALTDDESPAEGGGRGAVIGAFLNNLLPPALRGGVALVRGAKEFIKPSPGNLAAHAAGDKVDDVISALETNRAGTAGAQLNAGQAAVPAGSSEFSALQRLVDRHDPSRAALAAANNKGARETAVRGIGGTKQQLDSAVGARTAAGERNYPASYGVPVKGDREIVELSQSPYFQDALPGARKLAQAAKIKLDENGMPSPEDATQFLHYVKIELDKHMGRAGDTALGRTEKKVVTDLQDRLVKWLGAKNPKYETARAEWEAASKPINRMELGQELEGALVDPLGRERAGNFGAAVRRAGEDVDVTGKPRIDSLLPGQRKVVDALVGDLSREEAWKQLANSGMTSLKERIGAPQLPATGAFNVAASVFRSWFNRATGGFTEKGLKELAPLMQDPAALAQAMKQFTPQQQQQVQRAFQQLTLPAVGGITAATEQQ